jgi:hypothetical protein
VLPGVGAECPISLFSDAFLGDPFPAQSLILVYFCFELRGRELFFLEPTDIHGLRLGDIWYRGRFHRELLGRTSRSSRQSFFREIVPSRLTELLLYDNSEEADPRNGTAPEPGLLLWLVRGKVRETCELNRAPEWAKPILEAVLKLHLEGLSF